jgi:glutamyl-tRNA reductase|tara:strand:+ start:26 stop:1294 length:1269 start_codon:yes stop_codon:yes gene_type:complete
MSNIAILSINHQKAPVAIREKVAFAQGELVPAISALLTFKEIKGCVIFSTCNRSEIYVSHDSKNISDVLIKFLASSHGIDYLSLQEYVSYYEANEAVQHICNVACGLESLVLGEPQIFGQLKDAYQLSKNEKALDKILEKLFQHVFKTAKKVRTDTNIGSSPVSVAYCAVKLSEKIFTNLSNQTVLLIGAGEMIELSAQHLSKRGVKKMIFANRTIENAQPIAIKYEAEAISLKSLSENLHRADIVISSTAAPIPIIGKGLIETVLHQRKHKPMLLIDLAIPRDIEPEANQLEDIFLYSVDDLQQIANSNLEERLKEKVLAKEIINEKSVDFIEWANNIPNEEIIKNHRRQANLLKDELLQIALRKLKLGSNPDLVVEELADKLTNKLLHKALESLKNPNNSKTDSHKVVEKDTTKPSKIDN